MKQSGPSEQRRAADGDARPSRAQTARSLSPRRPQRELVEAQQEKLGLMERNLWLEEERQRLMEERQELCEENQGLREENGHLREKWLGLKGVVIGLFRTSINRS